jgi:hypothetical protein
MTGKKSMLMVILFVLTTVYAVQAQQPPASREEALRRLGVQGPPPDELASQPEIFYRLDFVIREMDGEKPVDTRNYSLWVQSGVSENMTAGSEVPYPAGSFSTTGSATTKNIQYRSIGVSIDCMVKEGKDSPQLDLKLNISDALPPEKDSDTPAFRNITLDSKALLTLGKPTTVSVVEDPGSRHRYQVEVTATKLN